METGISSSSYEPVGSKASFFVMRNTFLTPVHIAGVRYSVLILNIKAKRSKAISKTISCLFTKNSLTEKDHSCRPK